MHRHLARLLASVGMAALAVPAAGQVVETLPGGGTAAAAVEAGEIVVTAQKRVERLQDVPISIAVTQGRLLEDFALDSAETLQSLTPNLSITDTPANNSVFVRGIGTSGNQLAFEQAVALFVDGVYGGRNRQFNQPFLDVERIEVLRGPQGALFGRNTSAGAINVVTRKPTFDFEGYGIAEVEAVRGGWSLTGAASGPITPELAARFVVRQNQGYGFIDNVRLNRKEPARNDTVARASLLWEPADNTAVFAKVEYSKSDITGSPFEYVPRGTRPDYIVDTDDRFYAQGDRSDALNAVLEADIGLGDHTLTAITGYSAYDYEAGFSIAPRFPTRLVTINRERFRQWSQEVRLLSPTGGFLEYVIGGYVEGNESNIFRNSIFDIAPPPPAPERENIRFLNIKQRVLSPFGSVTLRPVDQLRVIAGLRWTRVRREGDFNRFQNFYTPAGTLARREQNQQLSARPLERDLTPSVTVQFEPTTDVMVYGKYAEGFKGGTLAEFDQVTAATFVIRPERAKTYEAGLRLNAPSVRGYLYATVFRTDYRDLQKSSVDPLTASFITQNAAGARSQGVEVEAALRPTEAISIRAAVAYLDAKYTSWPTGPCTPPRAGQTGCFEERAGDRLQNAPEWTGNVVVTLDQPVSDRLRVIGSAIVNYQSSLNFQDNDDPLEVQPGFSKTDLRLGVADIDRRWELAVLARNLFDKRTAGLIFQLPPFASSPGDRGYLPEPGRTITIQARVNF